jgi:hypothetical protein
MTLLAHVIWLGGEVLALTSLVAVVLGRAFALHIYL